MQTTVTPVERLTRFHVMRSDVVALRRALDTAKKMRLKGEDQLRELVQLQLDRRRDVIKHFDLGRDALRAREWDKARAKFERVGAFAPRLFEAKLLLGEARLGLGDARLGLSREDAAVEYALACEAALVAPLAIAKMSGPSSTRRRCSSRRTRSSSASRPSSPAAAPSSSARRELAARPRSAARRRARADTARAHAGEATPRFATRGSARAATRPTRRRARARDVPPTAPPPSCCRAARPRAARPRTRRDAKSRGASMRPRCGSTPRAATRASGSPR